jgi:hypothetical protein
LTSPEELYGSAPSVLVIGEAGMLGLARAEALAQIVLKDLDVDSDGIDADVAQGFQLVERRRRLNLSVNGNRRVLA